MKPFKPLTIVGRDTLASQQSTQLSEPPAKRRRISYESDESDDGDDVHTKPVAAAASFTRQPQVAPKFRIPGRTPLVIVPNPSSSLPPAESGPEGYYTVLWRIFTRKKNKTWDGDGVLSVVGESATLFDISGRELGRGKSKGPLLVGSEMSIAGREIEVESMISKEDFVAGRSFLGRVKSSQQTPKASLQLERVVVKPVVKRGGALQTPKDRPNAPAPSKDRLKARMSSDDPSKAKVVSRTSSANSDYKSPMLHNTVQQANKDSKVPTPRHDPNRENALVMKRPSSAPNGRQVVDVVVDPLLTHGERKLREHQRAGVSFLYECVMGMKDYDGEGAVLADEMGLGKTLQTIALLWTLLKQNPIYGEPPVIKKALIVCPVTLINTWRRELNRWLGAERIGVFVVKDKKTRLTDFTRGKNYSVMIIGYEKLRLVQEELQKGDGIDIVIADEGHRLKTAQNKSAQAIKSLKTERRIILSGTPLQNDLAEFYTMVDFVNPGLLGKYTAFKREFEAPIVKSQQPSASEKDQEKGQARSLELSDLTSKFILRRTAEILAGYLPPKTEYVVFCRPTKAQKTVYRAIINSHMYSAALGSSAVSLELINILRKVCNSPNLLLKKDDKGANISKQELLDIVPKASLLSAGASGKLQVLDSLLHHIRTTTEEKVVLVSNYTSTLDILGNLLSSLAYKFLRLDGSTPASKRQDIVDNFNRSSPTTAFVFLLSAKAGGTGLNLHGASRLVLFDLDWNPATDLQAMARVHRDGQKRACYIYRLVTQGALDEKIFQRQVSKTGLADSIVDGKNGASGFTREELRDLFSLDEDEACQTHRLLGCDCGGKGVLMETAAEEEEDDGKVGDQEARNDLAVLSAGSDHTLINEDGVEVVHLDNDEPPSSYSSGGWMKAKDYDLELEQADLRRHDGKAKMLALMQYTHFDTSRVADVDTSATAVDEEEDDDDDDNVPAAAPDPLEGVIEDAVLRSVLSEGERRIGFVFSKLSG